MGVARLLSSRRLNVHTVQSLLNHVTMQGVA